MAKKLKRKLVVPLPDGVGDLDEDERAVAEHLVREIADMHGIEGEYDVVLIDKDHEMVKDGIVRHLTEPLTQVCAFCEKVETTPVGEFVVVDQAEDYLCYDCLMSSEKETH